MHQQPENGISVAIPLAPREIQLSFSGITYSASKGSSKIAKPILDNISGSFRSGRLTAIIGPSGAGKSSLLNVLSGFRSKGITGVITVNDEVLNQQNYRKLVTYNTQDIALLPNITVQETLEFAVDLRMRSARSRKRKIVQEIISVLGLQKCAHSQVRVLSGGEKKRLSIGQDLISNPQIMLFDEPTSGLDSEASYQLVSYLKELTKQNRCVVSIVHQPSSDLLELFDDIYVVFEGRCMYRGTLNDLIPWFESVGLVCPQYYNRADFVIKMASASNPDKSKVYQLMYQMESHQTPQKIDHQSSTSKKYPTSGCNQLSTLIRRTTLGTIRNFALAVLRFGGLICFSTIMGIVYYNIGNDAAKVISNTAFINLGLSCAVFVNAVAVVLSFPMEAAVFIREYKSNCYSVTAYYFAKLIADFIPMITGNILFGTIGYYMTGQPSEVHRMMGYMIMVCLLGWFGQIFGLLGGCLFPIEISPFVVPVGLLPMLLFGGFFIKFDELIVAFRPLVYLSPFKYAFEGIAQSLYGYNRTELPCSVARDCTYKSGEDVMQMLDMEDVEYQNSVIGLSVIVLLLHVFVFICLLSKVK